MLQIGHYKIFFSLHKDDFLDRVVHCATFRCDANYGFLWLWVLQWERDQENSSLLLDDLVKQDLFLTKQKWPCSNSLPLIKKQMDFFTYFCCVASYFSAEFCHSFLFGDYVSQLTSFYPVISVYSNSTTTHKMLSICMHLFPSW